MDSKTKVLGVLLVVFAVVVAGCGGSTPISIAFNLTGPQNAIAGQALNVTATVAHDSQNKGVTWSLTGPGTLSAQTTTSVTYTAPSPIASNGTATITASSVANTMKVATLTINLQAVTLALTPSAAQTLEQTQTLSVTATISNDPSTTPSVTWSLNTGAKGALSGQTATGVTYHAPASVTAAATDTITATSVFDNTKTQTLTINLVPPPSVTTTTLPVGTVGVAYTTTNLTATGGVSPYTWSLTGGTTLPPGLTLSAAGAISGTPTQFGTFNFTVQAKDANNFTASANLSIKVNPAPVNITTTSLPNGVVNTVYSATLAATGGAPPITWSWVAQSGSSLPPGLVLAATGSISGTPTATGVFNVTVTASDSSTPALTALKNFSITIGQAPAFSSAASTTFTVGTAGTFTVTTTGFPAPALTKSGTLPSGVTFTDNGNGTGTLSGTPVVGTGKTYAITFTASNGVGSNATQNFTLTVSEAPSITSAISNTFTLNAPGTFNVTTSGFPTPSITESGTLPNGVMFTNNGNGTATLAGTPTQNGSFSITFTASNGVGSNATQNFTLTVNTAPVITSATSTTFTVGTNGSFTVTATGTPSPTITESGTLPTGVTFTGGTGTATLSGTPAAGTGGTYTITFTASNGVGTNATQTFTLTVDQAPAITSPNSTTFTEGVMSSFSVMTTGFPKPSITEAGALPGGVTFTDNGNGTGTLAGTPASGSSTGSPYSITFTANNTVGTPFVQTFTLTVNTAPVVTSANSTTFTTGTPGTFTVMATGTPTPAITESGTLPSGVTFTGGTGTATLSGTPATGTGGTYSITFTATSSSGTSHQTFTLTVDEAPSITSANSTTFTVGTNGSFTVTTTGFPKDPITETGALPSGVTLVDNGNNTATLSGTPAAGTAGSYPIVITASNGVLPNATQNFMLTVNATGACTTTGGSESLLSGGYAFLLKGFDNGSTPEPALVGAVLTFNGSGTISSGAIDMNLNSGVQSLTVTSGTYGVGSDHRGCMAITTSAGTQHYAFSVANISGGVASTAHVIDFDAAGPFTTGAMLKQSGGPFSNASVSGTYAFGASSIQNTAAAVGGGKFGIAGLITFNGSGGITSGSEDINQNGTLDGSAANTSYPATSPITFGASSSYSISPNGRGTMTIAILANGVAIATSHAFIYGVSSSHAFFMTSDAQTGTQIVGGEALLQSGTFSTNPLSGTYIGYDSGLGKGGAGTDRTDLYLIGPLTSGSNALSGNQYRNDGGTFASGSLAGQTYSSSTAGRIIGFSPGGGTPVLYLVSTSQAFLLAGNGSVDTGFIQSQTGTSASGAYAFGIIDPEDTNVGANSGVVTLSSGSITGASDNNSGSGPQGNQAISTTYSVDANGLGHIPSGCTPGTNCQLIFLVVSPTRAILTQLQHSNGTTQTSPAINPVDQ